jgi:hypothetical protein
MLTTRDARGEPMTVGDVVASPERFEAALGDVVRFAGDPVGKIEAALAADPALVLGHLLRAHTFLFALQPGFGAKAAASIAAAEALAGQANERERLHLAAAKAWAGGDLTGACAAFDAVLAAHPRDLLAMMFAHQADFFAGRTEALEARPRAALAAWAPDLPGRSHVQSMLAFGLEEAGAYGEAEALGREAVARDPRDVWGVHAVGHVLEMQGRDEEGIAWYGEREGDWAAPGCFFAVHNAWHLALYHVDREDPAAALAAYDRLIRPGRRSILLNLCDAASLLWRLHLAGVDVGPRWDELADLMAPHALARVHVFDDVHLAIAFAAAGRGFALMELLRSLEEQAQGEGDRALMTRLVGLPAARAMAAFAHGAHPAAVDQLLALRPHARLMTGSHAQRDVLELTLIEAALRDGQLGLARGLLERRLAAKPASARIRRDLARCGTAVVVGAPPSG